MRIYTYNRIAINLKTAKLLKEMLYTLYLYQLPVPNRT
ncbi:hypothetical protein SAMN05444008_101362 [Cnuella takakiae]|uniref:Uncharacterized protein n=1 Tax=Cnuella takakiae TaxID=1302690 RepID=A0A1M4T9V5_9BACT|nr:hypothetical protein SAMN05444008_101362 [Cnuella takakiae]